MGVPQYDSLCAILLPPLGVSRKFGCCSFKFWICLLLTLLGYIPGLAYSNYIMERTVAAAGDFIMLFFLPPFAIFCGLRVGRNTKSEFWICLLLTMLGYLPGIIYAICNFDSPKENWDGFNGRV